MAEKRRKEPPVQESGGIMDAIRRWVDQARYGMAMDNAARRQAHAVQQAAKTGRAQSYAVVSLDDWIEMGRPGEMWDDWFQPEASIPRPGVPGQRMFAGRGDRTRAVTVLPNGKTMSERRPQNQHPNNFFGPVG